MPTAHNLFRSALPLLEWTRRHPTAVPATVLSLLLGSALTAFGTAPMSLPAPPPPEAIRQVLATLEVPDLHEQLQALDQGVLALHHSDLTRASDTADSLLARLGVADPEAAAFLRTDPIAQRILMGRTGKAVQVQGSDATTGGHLQRLVARGPATDSRLAESHFSRITVERRDGRLQSERVDLPLERLPRLGAGVIRSSLFAAADEAGLPDAVTVQLAEIFSVDIDFRRELRKDDRFSVIYEALLADGEPVTWGAGTGRVLAATFVNHGKTREAVWFQPEGSERGAYFDLEGTSKARSFLASPLAFSRVTSGFAMRLHPIHREWRAHLGVDYAAPTGTPIRSVGDGTVEFAGTQNGYGNVVVIRHRGGTQSVYAHLSRIDVRQGEALNQGATIGAVGATGWATGPHLHFEIKVDGQHVDPMQIARTSDPVNLTAADRQRFQPVAATARARLAALGDEGRTVLARME